MRRFLSTAVASAALALSVASPAAAQTPTPTSPACTAWTQTAIYAANPLLVGSYRGCVGAFAENLQSTTWDAYLRTATFTGSTFGNATYPSLPGYSGKSDDAGNGPFTSNPGGTTGTLTFDSPVSGLFAIGLKAGNSFSVYLFNTGATSISSFVFNTVGSGCNPSCETVNGLSHAALFRGPSTTVPEPSTYVLMAAGLAGLGLVARRRRA